MLHYPQLAMQLAIEGGMAMMDTIYNIDNIKAQPQVQIIQYSLIIFFVSFQPNGVG